MAPAAEVSTVEVKRVRCRTKPLWESSWHRAQPQHAWQKPLQRHKPCKFLCIFMMGPQYLQLWTSIVRAILRDLASQTCALRDASMMVWHVKQWWRRPVAHVTSCTVNPVPSSKRQYATRSGSSGDTGGAALAHVPPTQARPMSSRPSSAAIACKETLEAVHQPSDMTSSYSLGMTTTSSRKCCCMLAGTVCANLSYLLRAPCTPPEPHLIDLRT